mmetsp:Transcript_7861/g.12797  ORF Transcript_7861/g.12797 Transcript_7861/m.12797 type:complete len:208 (-) Transcript_7861:1436-2059(-)
MSQSRYMPWWMRMNRRYCHVRMLSSRLPICTHFLSKNWSSRMTRRMLCCLDQQRENLRQRRVANFSCATESEPNSILHLVTIVPMRASPTHVQCQLLFCLIGLSRQGEMENLGLLLKRIRRCLCAHALRPYVKPCKHGSDQKIHAVASRSDSSRAPLAARRRRPFELRVITAAHRRKSSSEFVKRSPTHGGHVLGNLDSPQLQTEDL